MHHNTVFSHLLQTPLKKLSAENNDLLTVKPSDTIEAAVRALRTRGVLAAPVINSHGKLVGMLEAQELVSFLAELTNGAKKDLRQLHVADAIRHGRGFAMMDPSDNVAFVLELFAKGYHRVALTTGDSQLVGLTTQVDVVMQAALLMRQEHDCKSFGARTLADFGERKKELAKVLASQSVGDTVAQLDEAQVSALPIVDVDGKLVGTFSVTNLLALWSDESIEQSLSMTVADYLHKHSPSSMTPLTAKYTDHLVDVVTRMVEKMVHRFWIVDEKNAPVGVITMSDVCALICHYVETGAPDAKRDAFTANFRSTFDGKALGVDAAHNKVALLDDVNDRNAQWRVQHLPVGSLVTLQAANGKFLSVDKHQHVALVDSSSSDCHLLMMTSDTGTIAFHSDQGGFLEPHGGAVVSHKQSSTTPLKRQWWRMHMSALPPLAAHK